MVGSTHFIDAVVQVPRTYPIDRVEEIKRKAQANVARVLDDADLAFTAVPVARDNESVRELGRLNDRELADIGISRSEIGRVARDNARTV